MSDIDVTRKGFKCLRCGYVWIPRFGRAPKLCPKCRSYLWNRPRVRLVAPQDEKGKTKRVSVKKLAKELNPKRQAIRAELGVQTSGTQV